jgi:putative SOS response-associated peptidase YedK
MCGRFVSARKRLELLEEFSIERDSVAAGPDPEPGPDYNVAPTRRVYAVMERRPRDTQASQPPARELAVVRWGLVPSWAKDASGSGRLINARAETVAVKPAFRRAFARRRCILPADGYYEWQAVTEDGKQRKQPYYIVPKDGGTLAFAGVYEFWRDQTLPEDHEHAWLCTAAIITTRATDDVGEIHDRMPMVIEPDHWADWLDPDHSEPGELSAAMQPAMAGGLTSFPVSMAVNSVRNNGPELIVPLPADQGRPPGELFLARGARPGLTGARAARRTRTEARTNGDYRRP